MTIGRRVLLYLPLLILLGCRTTSVVPPEETVTPLPERRFDLLGTAKKNIAVSTPDTLKSAILLLSESAEGESETGQELLFLAAALMERVYPLAWESEILYTPPGGSLFVSLFEAVDHGQIPEIAQDDVSFFTTLLTPLALLNSQGGAVFAASLEALEQLTILNPESVLPVYLLGVLAEKKGALEEARGFYHRAVEMGPSCYPAETGAARIAIETGAAEEGILLLERQLLRYPDEDQLIKLLGEGYLKAGEYERALELVTGALLTSPEDTELLFLRARILERLGRYESARRLLSVVEKKLPGTPELILLKARLLIAAEDIRGALDLLTRGRELYPGKVELENSYGELLLKSGRAAEGREILNRHLEEAPESVESLRLLLQDAVERKAWEEAEGFSERLLTLEKDKASLIQGFEIARILGRTERAADLMADLVQAYPKDTQVVLLRGEYLLSLGEKGAAREWLDAAVTENYPSAVKSEIYYLLSRTSGEDDFRIDFLRASLLENLENVPALLALSRIYVSREEYRNAQRYLKQAALLEPENEDVRRALQEVERKLR